jgi:hypothetical protein
VVVVVVVALLLLVVRAVVVVVRALGQEAWAARRRQCPPGRMRTAAP